MAVVVDVRNPNDLVSSYDQIEIQRNTANAVSGMADIKTDLDINTSTASDLSTGYSTYTDEDGDVDTHYYRFRYKHSGSGAVSAWSEIFKAGTTVLHTRFRNKMKDTNSNNYFFSNDEVDDYLTHAVENLHPITWFETYLDDMIDPDGETKVFNFAVGVTRVSKIEFLDSDGNNLGRLVSWEVSGRRVIFQSAPRDGITIRVWVDKMFLKLAEVPAIWDSYLLNRMRLEAYEKMEADRASYYKYNAIAKPEGGNLPSLDKIITRLELQIQKRENQLRRVRKPAFIGLA